VADNPLAKLPKISPQISLGMGLATAAIVWMVYSNALPPVADVRSAPQDNTHIDGTRKMASWTAAGVVGGISLIAKDPTVFVLGSGMIIALDIWYRHADAVNPTTGKATQAASMAAAGTTPGDVQVQTADGVGTY
jgi:hypothetical protein